MSKPYKYYLITEMATVEGTNDEAVANAAKEDGFTTVLEPSTGKYFFDSTECPVTAADNDDWVEPTDESGEDGK